MPQDKGRERHSLTEDKGKPQRVKKQKGERGKQIFTGEEEFYH